jgi:hypothetical protein
MSRRLAAVVCVTATVATVVVAAAAAEAAPCAGDASSTGIARFFSGDDAAGLAGGDYPHALPLPDGRVLWTLQDAFVGVDANLRDDEFSHNLGIVQSGSCFSLLVGGSGSWIGSEVEQPLRHWFWPLDTELGADGLLWVFLAEMSNPRGTGAAAGAVPIATWRARVRLPDLQVVDIAPASDPSTDLFGYSIVSDSTWSYLYGHCYRQFVPETAQGFDPSCSPFAYLARVPRGHFELSPEYWSTQGWTPDSSAKTPVITGNGSAPVSVQKFGDGYVAASDEGDWWGSTVIIRTALRPEGPWALAATMTPPTRCGAGCNNYGAFVMPSLEAGRVVIAYSNNAWTMDPDAFDNASLYRISVATISVPDVPHITFPVVAVSGPRRSIAWIAAVVLLLVVVGVGAVRWRATRLAARRTSRSSGPVPLPASPRATMEDQRAARR